MWARIRLATIGSVMVAMRWRRPPQRTWITEGQSWIDRQDEIEAEKK